MNAYGIELIHRNPKKRGNSNTSKDFSQFVQFAALIKFNNVSQHIKYVLYDTNSDCFYIDADESMKFTDPGGAIDWCANCTLDQYELFGDVHHKNGLDKKLP